MGLFGKKKSKELSEEELRKIAEEEAKIKEEEDRKRHIENKMNKNRDLIHSYLEQRDIFIDLIYEKIPRNKANSHTFSGMYLSGIFSNSVKQTKLLEEILQELKKLNERD